MKKLTTIITLVIIATMGVVGAQQPDGPNRNMDDISNATGLSREDIIQMSQQDGKTLAEIITENGGDISAVTSEARVTLVTRLEEAVSNERMSQEDADALLTTLDAALNTAGTFQMRPEGGRGNG